MWAKRETVLVKYDCDNLAEQRQILVTKPVGVKEGEIRGKYLYCYLEHFISVMRENKHELFTIVTMDLGSDNCQYCKHRMPIRDITVFHHHIYFTFSNIGEAGVFVSVAGMFLLLTPRRNKLITLSAELQRLQQTNKQSLLLPL